MTYTPLPAGTKVTKDEFIRQMNLALVDMGYAQKQFSICSDNNGYWLELNGIRVLESDVEASALLSALQVKVNIH